MTKNWEQERERLTGSSGQRQSGGDTRDCKVNKPPYDRSSSCNPAGLRAVIFARNFVFNVSMTEALSKLQAQPVCELARQLSTLPAGIVTQDLYIEVASQDQHELADSAPFGDVSLVCLRSVSGLLMFELSGMFAGDTYDQGMFSVELGEFMTRGLFAHLVAWEACASRILSLPGFTVVIET